MLAILARVFAASVHILHGFLSYLSEQLFVDTAESAYLDRHGNIWGTPRLAATFAQGTVQFTGSPDGTIIPSGTIVNRDDGIEFETTEESTITSGIANVMALSKSPGEIGNTSIGTVLTLNTGIVGIDSEVNMEVAAVGGADLETDEPFRARILARIQNPPAGGSASDYVTWARSVAGVLNAYVYPNYYGLGTVAVIVTGTSTIVPDAGIIADVQSYIDVVRPVTADVTVSPIVSSEVTFEINISPNTLALRNAITTTLGEMFRDDAVPGGTLLISHIHEAVLTSGLLDYEIIDISVDGSPVTIGNITFTGFDYPVLGTITFGDM
jgi:uncharacterized phage protein gp47/JayE